MTLFDKEQLRKLLAQKESWTNQELAEALAKLPERSARFTTISSQEIKRVYTPLDTPDIDYEQELGMPGQLPFTRGVHPTMYRGRPWTMRQFAGFSTPKETNQRLRHLLAQGQTGLSIAFDLPTLMGYDADHSSSHGEVGKCGVACSSLLDMEAIFDGLDIENISTSLTANGTAPVVFALYLACAQKRGVPLSRLSGTLQNDILKEYIAQHEWLVPMRPAVKMVVDVIEFCTQQMPRWNGVSISGSHMREAGATAIQELAFTLADGVCYVEECLRRGLSVDSFASRLSFHFNVHNDLFEEVTKLRAARRIWAHLMKERFGAKDPRSMMLRTHAKTSGASLTAQQPMNNIVRVTTQAIAAILGGAQSLHTSALDEALGLPSEQTATLALRTQQILAEESGLTNTVDPLGGSFFIEALTDHIEAEVYAALKKIDDLGGMLCAIEQEYPQRELNGSAMRYQHQVESREKIIVGVNQHQAQEQSMKAFTLNAPAEASQKQKLQTLRRERDNERVQRALSDLREAAKRGQNVMPPLINCASAYATLGEMCDVLRDVFGVYQP